MSGVPSNRRRRARGKRRTRQSKRSIDGLTQERRNAETRMTRKVGESGGRKGERCGWIEDQRGRERDSESAHKERPGSERSPFHEAIIYPKTPRAGNKLEGQYSRGRPAQVFMGLY